MNYLKIDQCEERRLYRLQSRNLRLGVFNPTNNNGFLGIREKFGSRYIFTEFHWDNGLPFGTVKPLEALEEKLPENIRLEERLGSQCDVCKGAVDYRPWESGKDDNGFPGRWVHLSGIETCGDEFMPHAVYNNALHEWLEEMEKKYNDQSPVHSGRR